VPQDPPVIVDEMAEMASRVKTGPTVREAQKAIKVTLEAKEATGLVCACESSGRTPSTYQAIMYLPSPQTATITQCSLQRKPSLRKITVPRLGKLG
jgi:hypothetical protein